MDQEMTFTVKDLFFIGGFLVTMITNWLHNKYRIARLEEKFQAQEKDIIDNTKADKEQNLKIEGLALKLAGLKGVQHDN